MILDIGARTTNLLFLEGNRVFSRSIPIAGNAISQSIAAELNVSFAEAEQLKRAKGFVALGGAYEEPADEQQARISKIIRNVMTRLHAEVARSVNFYKGQQSGSPPRRLLLSGGSSIIPYTDRFFQEKLQIPIEYFNPFQNIEIGSNISREDLSRCAHFLGEVVGLGLRRVTECPLEVNLLPRSIRARKQMNQRQPYFIGAAACLLLIPFCWLAYTQKTANLKQRELADVQQELQSLQQTDQSLKTQKRQLDDVKGKADQIVTVLKQRSFWPEFLDDFTRRVPQGIWITELRPLTAAEAASPTTAGGEEGGGPRRPGRFQSQENEERAPITEAPAASAGPTTITDIEIAGGGQHTMQDLTLVAGFADSLRQSSFFGTNATDVVLEKPPSAMPKEAEFTFMIRAKLATPITY
jgi:Tfp pilus assembly protein PilN